MPLAKKNGAGNTQMIIKGRWLHHSSLLWDYNPANMDYLLMPSKCSPIDKAAHTPTFYAAYAIIGLIATFSKTEY